MQKFRDSFRALREDRLKKSQEELAELLGISQDSISYYETKAIALPSKVLRRLKDVVGYEFDEGTQEFHEVEVKTAVVSEDRTRSRMFKAPSGPSITPSFTLGDISTPKSQSVWPSDEVLDFVRNWFSSFASADAVERFLVEISKDPDKGVEILRRGIKSVDSDEIMRIVDHSKPAPKVLNG